MTLRVLAIVMLLGCSGKHTPRTHQVAIRGMQFVPAQLSVDVGDTITWTNEDVMPHTVTAAGAATAFDSKDIAAKATWSLTVSATGDYAYVCSYHPTMKGQLAVH